VRCLVVLSSRSFELKMSALPLPRRAAAPAPALLRTSTSYSLLRNLLSMCLYPLPNDGLLFTVVCSCSCCGLYSLQRHDTDYYYYYYRHTHSLGGHS
jgi:hypothetical protein